MFAEKDYNEGDSVICYDPVAFGPSLKINKRICIGCLIAVDNSFSCDQCNWPTCSDNCSKLHYHQSAECEILKNVSLNFNNFCIEKKSLYSQYDFILPLRLLLVKDKEPDKWSNIMQMKRPKLNDGASSKSNIEKAIAKCIRSNCKLKFTEELIYEVCGIIERNGITHYVKNQNMVCVYEDIHHISHNCRPNVSYTISPAENFKIFIRAAVHISRREEIFISKTNILSPTLLRRKILLYNKLIICDCDRCCDNSELGTHMSSVKCPKCSLGYIVSLDPLDYEADWKCGRCKFCCQYNKVQILYNAIIKDLIDVENGNNLNQYPSMFKNIITKNKSKLHPTHAFMIYMKMCSLMLEFNNEFEVTVSEDVMNENLEMAKTVLKVLDVITPGYSMHRCGIFYVMHKLLLTLAINQRNKKEITKRQFDKDIKMAFHYGELANKMSSIVGPFIAEQINVAEVME